MYKIILKKNIRLRYRNKAYKFSIKSEHLSDYYYSDYDYNLSKNFLWYYTKYII